MVLRYKAGPEGEVPVTEEEVRELVSWGVQDMEPASVAVVMKAEARSLTPLKPAELTQVGPSAVSAGTKGWLQGLIAGLCLVILVLGGLLAFFATRRSPTAVAAAE